jgi:cation diffusion facilitator CzcD-associated flavoprotein CzcO
MNKIFDIYLMGSETQVDSLQRFKETMKQRLGNDEKLASRIIPTFPVGCRRITPGNGYLEALIAPNTTVEFSGISHITAGGIKTIRGTEYKFDAIICATGFDTSYRPSFSVVGTGGKDLRDLWAEEPNSYLSVGAAGFPNYFSKACDWHIRSRADFI